MRFTVFDLCCLGLHNVMLEVNFLWLFVFYQIEEVPIFEILNLDELLKGFQKYLNILIFLGFFSLLKIPLFCFSCLSYKSIRHSLCYAVNGSEYCNKLYDFHSNLRAVSSLTVCLSLLCPSCLSDMGRFFLWPFFFSNKYFAVFSFLLTS